ncbi:TIGR04140 family protein [Thermococcus waiotapuensis]|uniref:TIGR04140 family protein n=1 Tax=Thermococcus waiotapuensis TaxID=90909 RepID=A0AAE4NXW7_9EURY|nr:TIGR04140 family protein [Thermococcus waiotapuensis]MDV3104715.1 TIGR04140 family protein [Thermococcus waiotapuensis]
MRIIETPIPLKELDEIRERSGAKVSLTPLGRTRRNGITLNRVLIQGNQEEIERFMEFLMRSRAGG